MDGLLCLDGIAFRYGQDPVLDGVSLRLSVGSFLGLVGPNGSGKTTLLRIAAGLLKPQRGGVRLGGQPVSAMKRTDFARRLALLPQKPSLPATFSCWEMVMMGRTPYLGFLARESASDESAVRRAMEMADCSHLAERRLDELSGGEVQRVLMARALAQQPEVLLLDEPTAHMDVHHQAAVAELIRRLVADGMAALGVFHDLNLAACYCDEVAVLSGGRLIAVGPPAEAMTQSVLGRAFGDSLLVTSHPRLGVPAVLPSGDGTMKAIGSPREESR